MRRLLLLAVLPLMLSGCTIPTIAVVGVAVDSVTFLSTGKSIPSHTMTEVTKKDCSVLYGITRGQFCKEKEKYYDNTSRDAGLKAPRDKPVETEVAPPNPPKNELLGPQAVLEPTLL